MLEVRDEASSEEGERQVELSIDANESVTQTVYYELESIEDLAGVNIVGEAYDFNIANLLRLPYQSALYVSDNARQAFFFDFQTLYAASIDPVDMEHFTESRVDTLSEEGKSFMICCKKSSRGRNGRSMSLK